MDRIFHASTLSNLIEKDVKAKGVPFEDRLRVRLARYKLSVANNTIKNWERGFTEPKATFLAAIAAELGVSIYDFYKPLDGDQVS